MKEFTGKSGKRYRVTKNNRIQKLIVGTYKNNEANKKLGRAGQKYENWGFVSKIEVQNLHKGGFLGILAGLAMPILAQYLGKKMGLGVGKKKED